MMKKITLLCSIIAFSLLFSNGIFAQQLDLLQSNKQVIFDNPYSTALEGTRSTACGPDTVLYPLAKATGVEAYLINASSFSSFGQYFDAPQSITVNGFDFYAWVDSSTIQTVTLTCNLYLAGVDSLPAGSPLASGVVVIDSTYGTGSLNGLKKTVTFLSPATITAPYVITVETSSNIDVAMVSNSSTAGDGQNERLSIFNFNGFWYNGAAAALDVDILLMPYVSYSVTSGFTMSTTATTGNSTIAFTNTSSPIVSNRMYNVAVFDEIANFTWNYGDGFLKDTLQESHLYVNNGCYDVTLIAKMFPWGYSTCFDNSTQSTAGNAPVAGFTFTNTSLAVTFNSSTSTGSPTSYSWDFGDSSPIDNTANPTHTYATNGNYTVILTVTNGCGTNVITQVVNLTTVSIGENSKATVFAIYPNPSNGVFTLVFDNNQSDYNKLEVMNLAGELVYSKSLNNRSASFNENINLNELAKGIYSVRITSNNSTMVKKLTIN